MSLSGPTIIQNLFTAIEQHRLPQEPIPEGSSKLAQLLRVETDEITSIRPGRVYHYRSFAISKKDGRERHILAPSPALKALQQRLLRRYLAFLPVHPAATAFMPGASIVRNVQRHTGQAVLATIDLADFFESTAADRVRRFFVRQGWRGEALGLLMRLCTYRNGLPQGAPTSPCLSNLVNLGLDTALDELARRSHATYTRYGDDLTFSWPNTRVPAHFKAAVLSELLVAGYHVQPRKEWTVTEQHDRPQITGLVLQPDGTLAPDSGIQAKINHLRRQLCIQQIGLWARLTDPRKVAKTQKQLDGYNSFVQHIRGT